MDHIIGKRPVHFRCWFSILDSTSFLGEHVSISVISGHVYNIYIYTYNTVLYIIIYIYKYTCTVQVYMYQPSHGWFFRAPVPVRKPSGSSREDHGTGWFLFGPTIDGQFGSNGWPRKWIIWIIWTNYRLSKATNTIIWLSLNFLPICSVSTQPKNDGVSSWVDRFAKVAGERCE